jgi:hypothetical protein
MRSGSQQCVNVVQGSRTFTAITRVQIPSGTPIESIAYVDFRRTLEGAKSHISVLFGTLKFEHGYAVPMMESLSTESVIELVIGKNKASTAACAACLAGATAWV